MSTRRHKFQTKCFGPTINGLMTKRAELYRARMVVQAEADSLSADIAILDRALEIIGYDADPDDAMPKQVQNPLFKRGQLRRLIYEALREHGPMTCREIAAAISGAEGAELSAVAKRVDRSLYKAHARGELQREAREGRWIWRVGSDLGRAGEGGEKLPRKHPMSSPAVKRDVVWE